MRFKHTRRREAETKRLFCSARRDGTLVVCLKDSLSNGGELKVDVISPGVLQTREVESKHPISFGAEL